MREVRRLVDWWYGCSDFVILAVEDCQEHRVSADFHKVPVLRHRGKLIRCRSDWTESIVGLSCLAALTM